MLTSDSQAVTKEILYLFTITSTPGEVKGAGAHCRQYKQGALQHDPCARCIAGSF